MIYLIDDDINFISRIDINNLTIKCLSRLIDIYASNATRFKHFRQSYLTKMNINTKLFTNDENNADNNKTMIEYNKSKKNI